MNVLPSSVLKVVAAGFSETLVTTYKTVGFTAEKATIFIINPRVTDFLSLRVPTDFHTVTTTFTMIVLYILLISMPV
jgi:hypothetical protein